MNVDGMLARRHSLERELEQAPAGVCNRETVEARRDTRIIPRWNRTAATSQRLASISAGSDVQSGCHAIKKPELFRGDSVAPQPESLNFDGKTDDPQ